MYQSRGPLAPRAFFIERLTALIPHKNLKAARGREVSPGAAVPQGAGRRQGGPGPPADAPRAGTSAHDAAAARRCTESPGFTFFPSWQAGISTQNNVDVQSIVLLVSWIRPRLGGRA